MDERWSDGGVECMCVRALGMPGFTDAGISSAPLERQRYPGNRGPQIACGPSGVLHESYAHERFINSFTFRKLATPWPS